jgi:hypothetical protein
MNTIKLFGFAVIALASLSSACSVQNTDITDQDFMDSPSLDPDANVANGLKLNGFVINGFTVNGTALGGASLIGAKFTDMSLNGFPVSDVWLSYGHLAGYVTDDSSDRIMYGADFAGVTLKGVFSDQSEIPLVIDSVDELAAELETDNYFVSYQSTTGRQNLCGYDTLGQPIAAYPLAGTWNAKASHVDDPDHFTFACRGTALAKCVDWGYKPWGTVTEQAPTGGGSHQVSLAPLHQACTRMVRADYCGDGVSHTQNGTTINVWDNFGIQTRDATNFSFEANWTVSGAANVAKPRLNDAATAAYVQQHCPNRWAPNMGENDASTFSTASGYDTELLGRVLLKNESAAP